MIARRSVARLLAALLAAQAFVVGAVEVRFQRVAEGVYAHVGDIGARSVANEGLNANLEGDRAGQWSVRIIDQRRLCFVWTDAGPDQLEIVDYH